jgi:hypothetical protein
MISANQIVDFHLASHRLGKAALKLGWAFMTTASEQHYHGDRDG